MGDCRTVDIHVRRVRKKLDEDKNSSIIETVFGVGYKLV
ncbi:alkaline phosphatase synthesis transcriptional regulatory phoP domain protein, partial [Desulfosporosinus sp. OT]